MLRLAILRGFLYGLGCFFSILTFAGAVAFIGVALGLAPTDGHFWREIAHGGLLFVFSLSLAFLALRLTRVPDRPWGLSAILKFEAESARATRASRGFPPDAPDTTTQKVDRGSGYPPVIGWLLGFAFGGLLLKSAASWVIIFLDPVFK